MEIDPTDEKWEYNTLVQNGFFRNYFEKIDMKVFNERYRGCCNNELEYDLKDLIKIDKKYSKILDKIKKRENNQIESIIEMVYSLKNNETNRYVTKKYRARFRYSLIKKSITTQQYESMKYMVKYLHNSPYLKYVFFYDAIHINYDSDVNVKIYKMLMKNNLFYYQENMLFGISEYYLRYYRSDLYDNNCCDGGYCPHNSYACYKYDCNQCQKDFADFVTPIFEKITKREIPLKKMIKRKINQKIRIP